MTREQMEAFLARYIHAWNDHDVETLSAFYHRDAVLVSPLVGELRGRPAIENSYRRFFVEWPNVHAEVDRRRVLIDGPRLVLFSRIEFSGSYPTLGVAPAGGTVVIQLAVLLLEFLDGAIIHEQRMWDAHSFHGFLEKLVLDREIKSAAAIQRALLPRNTVSRAYCDIAGASIPCRMIGGDFFEHIDLPDGGIGFALGDVSGKGPPAALLTSMVQGLFASEIESGRGPAEILTRMNRLLAKRGVESRFATFFFGMLFDDGRFRYANAGHNPPIVLASSGDRWLNVGGTPLGMFEGASYEEENIQLAGGDAIVCFTDGVTEAVNAADEEFGEERLVVSLRRLPSSTSSEERIRHIFSKVREFCGDMTARDDITMLVVRFVPRVAG